MVDRFFVSTHIKYLFDSHFLSCERGVGCPRGPEVYTLCGGNEPVGELQYSMM